MKRRNKIILFLVVLILFLLFSFAPIESTQFNVKKIIKQEKIKGDVDLDKFHRNLDFILNSEKKHDSLTWGKNPFEKPAKLWGKKSEMSREKSKSFVSSPLKLNGVIIKGKEAWAIIDENVVKVGDNISGRTVEKIEMGKVILRSGQTEEVLILD
jgi:ribosome-associated protein YbcJ (S4-like RNA binding protein)